jgi:hypothetical protein
VEDAGVGEPGDRCDRVALERQHDQPGGAGIRTEQMLYPLETHPANPLEAPTGIDPVASSNHVVEPNLWA